jgi:hypothetical protein
MVIVRWILCLLLVLFSVPAFAAGPGNTDIAWTNSDPVALGVVVERHEGACGSGTFVDLPASKTTGTMLSTKDLTTVAGKTYCYRIRFWNYTVAGGNVMQYGPYSPEVAVTFPLVLAPPSVAPANLSVR